MRRDDAELERRLKRWLRERSCIVEIPEISSLSYVPEEMKKAGALAASVAAASSAAFASGSDRHAAPHPPSSTNEGSGSGKETESRRRGEEKFAPRFDGLKFIETLVTAHR